MRALVAVLLALVVCSPVAVLSGPSYIVPQGNATLAEAIRGLGIEYRRVVVTGPSLSSIQLREPVPDLGRFGPTLALIARVYHLTLSSAGDVVVVRSGGGSVKRIVLRYANASMVATELQASAGAGFMIAADPSSNALVLSGPRSDMQRVERMIQSLDVVPSAIGFTETIPVHTNPLTAAKELQTLFPQNVGTIAAYGDVHIGAVVVTGTPGQLLVARHIVASIQHHVRNVDIYVHVYDLTPVNSSSHIGFTWGTIPAGESYLGGVPSPNLTFSPFLPETIPLSVTFNALTQGAKAKILASPNVRVESGDTTDIHIGNTEPIVYSSGGLINTVQIETIKTGVTLTVTPIVEANDNIHLVLEIGYSEVTGEIHNYPIIASRTIHSTLDVKPSQLVTFGGLTEVHSTTSVSKVPILGDIPLLGALFRDTQTTKKREEIVFTLQVVPIKKGN
ncbi:MAG: secretin N-terminal domain-containing protein [Vulcanimicrobiaceae bacterium]